MHFYFTVWMTLASKPNQTASRTSLLNVADKIQNTQIKHIEIAKEKADIKQFYTDSSHNTGVVQSPCTFKGFHYNHIGLQIAQRLF